jgi:CspA family cold shock protein
LPWDPYIHGVPDFAAALLAAPYRGISQSDAEFGKGRGEWFAGPQSRANSRVFKKEPAMATGIVKFFNTQKGFGFISPTDGVNDFFVHISAVEKAGMMSLNEGQKVSYDVVTERGKLAAGNLQSA